MSLSLYVAIKNIKYKNGQSALCGGPEANLSTVIASLPIPKEDGHF